jgi:hypothetical protein
MDSCAMVLCAAVDVRHEERTRRAVQEQVRLGALHAEPKGIGITGIDPLEGAAPRLGQRSRAMLRRCQARAAPPRASRPRLRPQRRTAGDRAARARRPRGHQRRCAYERGRRGYPPPPHRTPRASQPASEVTFRSLSPAGSGVPQGAYPPRTPIDASLSLFQADAGPMCVGDDASFASGFGSRWTQGGARRCTGDARIHHGDAEGTEASRSREFGVRSKAVPGRGSTRADGGPWGGE